MFKRNSKIKHFKPRRCEDYEEFEMTIQNVQQSNHKDAKYTKGSYFLRTPLCAALAALCLCGSSHLIFFHLQTKIAVTQNRRCSNLYLYLSQSCIFTILPSLQLMILGLLSIFTRKSTFPPQRSTTYLTVSWA